MVLETISQFAMDSPVISILIFSSLISLLITIVNFFMLDKDRLREIKKRQKELQGEIKEHQKNGNQDKVMELNKELMGYIPETFKHSMKPMIITLIPILLLFAYIRGLYAETAIASTWFWWYLGGAIGSSIIFRKIFNLP
jgi:uncharacterized membrane protein (DUF106 family)